MIKSAKSLRTHFSRKCEHSVVGSESTLHQLAPYIGKIKSSIASFLIENFTTKGEIIFDPFCGAGTIPLEAWSLGRDVVANDLNPYAFLLTQAKLCSVPSESEIFQEIERISELVNVRIKYQAIDNTPEWVSSFFNPETLKEIIAWVEILKENNHWFLLSCLMGILHHQRPGFLSFPSSHTVPYLRLNKFPKQEYPELYQYRNVKERIIKKAKRALKRLPKLDPEQKRLVYNLDASKLQLNMTVDAVITSPPYMRQLDYARDNRLRLWFLGIEDYRPLDETISPKEVDFVEIITNCLQNWNRIIRVGGKCILFLGDNYSKKMQATLPSIIEDILKNKIGTFELSFKHESIIPTNRRVRRDHEGNKSETLLVFQKIRS